MNRLRLHRREHIQPDDDPTIAGLEWPKAKASRESGGCGLPWTEEDYRLKICDAAWKPSRLT